MGHAAVNHFGQGYKQLKEGCIFTYLKKTTVYADIVADSISRREVVPIPACPPSGPENLLRDCMEVETNTDSNSKEQSSEFARNPIPINSTAPDGETLSNHSMPSLASSDKDDKVALSSYSTTSEDLEYDSDDDHSDEHLVSGSDFILFVKDGALCLGWDSEDEDADGLKVDAGEDSDGEQSEVDDDDDSIRNENSDSEE